MTDLTNPTGLTGPTGPTVVTSAVGPVGAVGRVPARTNQLAIAKGSHLCGPLATVAGGRHVR